jgi:HEPN domain-containing protein
MPPDPALMSEVRAWLQKAADDLDVAARCLATAPLLTAPAAFHAQQAAEKSLKGFLVWNSNVFRKTHSRIELGQACVQIDAGLEPFTFEAVSLSGYAVETRYPGSWGVPSGKEAR